MGLPSTQQKTIHPVLRTFDKYNYRRRTYGIVINKQTNKVLLTSATGKAGAFILPGGGIDPGETPEESVVREVLEECGVVCKIDKYCQQVVNHSKKLRSWVYVCEKIEEMDDWPERDKRTRNWLSVEEARIVLRNHKADQADLLEFI